MCFFSIRFLIRRSRFALTKEFVAFGRSFTLCDGLQVFDQPRHFANSGNALAEKKRFFACNFDRCRIYSVYVECLRDEICQN